MQNNGIQIIAIEDYYLNEIIIQAKLLKDNINKIFDKSLNRKITHIDLCVHLERISILLNQIKELKNRIDEIEKKGEIILKKEA